MVALGKLIGNENYTDSIEILDLTSTEADCENFPKYPLKTAFAKGHLNREDEPIICGGYLETEVSTCHVFRQGHWMKGPPMTDARRNFALTKFPLGNGSVDLLVTGGMQGPI